MLFKIKIAILLAFAVILLGGCQTANGMGEGFKNNCGVLTKADAWIRENLW